MSASRATVRDRHVKPFRTVEDPHVLAAIGAWLHHVGPKCGWPEALLLRLAALLAGARELGRRPADAATTHVVLAGLFASFTALRGEVDDAVAAGPAAWAALWGRERRILDIAAGPRATRLERALMALGRRADPAS
ncbi:MAG: hypothetical protein R3B09_12395 [Nannocystaceae bacterium]